MFLLTEKLFEMKDEIVPDNCDNRCINATIINRAYYSAYSYASLWLVDIHNFKFKTDFKKSKNFETEHLQVRKALSNVGEHKISNRLKDSMRLRKTADYELITPLSDKNVITSMRNMKYVFNNLNF